MDRATFAAALGPVVEHSPWVAEAAWERRPFGPPRGAPARLRDRDPHRAGASGACEVLRAHPELAGREAAAGELTDASARRAARRPPGPR